MKGSLFFDILQKLKNEQLQKLLYDKSTQTQGQLAEALHASQDAISRRGMFYFENSKRKIGF